MARRGKSCLTTRCCSNRDAPPALPLPNSRPMIAARSLAFAGPSRGTRKQKARITPGLSLTGHSGTVVMWLHPARAGSAFH